ncbi:MAG: hypothetical protein K1X79_13795 [Oligoflexia bacterium]|nr:hypothetical protein [Oligoflexia bacterium]
MVSSGGPSESQFRMPELSARALESQAVPQEYVQFDQLCRTLEGLLRPSCPVHCELVARTALQELGFGRDVSNLHEARLAYLQRHCANEFAVGTALAQFGLAVDKTRLTVQETENRGARASYRDESQGLELILEFKRGPNGKVLNLDLETSRLSNGSTLVGSNKSGMREVQLLAGLARDAMGEKKAEIAGYQSIGALLLGRQEQQLASSVFWSQIGQGTQMAEAFAVHVARAVLDPGDPERFGFFRQPARYIRATQNELAPIKDKLESDNRQSAITSRDEAERVARLVVEFREGRLKLAHQVVVPDGENPKYITYVRRPGLLDPVQAVAGKERFQRAPLATLLKAGTADTGPDEWKPALRAFYDGLAQPAEKERAEKVIRFLVDAFFPYVDRTPGDQLDGNTLVERYVQPFMKEGAPITFAYYYGFYKSQSPLRTGSRSSHIGPAEFEMLRNLAEIAKTANDRLGVQMRFVVVDELSAFSNFEPQYRLGYKPIEVDENHRRAHRYLEGIGAEELVLLRNFPEDLKLALGEDEFDRQWQDQLGKIDRDKAIPDHRIHILISCLPYEDLRSLGLKPAEIAQIYTNHLMGLAGREHYPGKVIDIVADAAVRFDALMKLRPVAAEKVRAAGLKEPPQFSDIAAPIGVTHQGSRLSINPVPRFCGNATLPLHGIPIYEGGEMCGCVPLWKALRHPELFTAYVNPRGEPLWFEYRLTRAAVEKYLETHP